MRWMNPVPPIYVTQGMGKKMPYSRLLPDCLDLDLMKSSNATSLRDSENLLLSPLFRYFLLFPVSDWRPMLFFNSKRQTKHRRQPLKNERLPSRNSQRQKWSHNSCKASSSRSIRKILRAWIPNCLKPC